MNRNIQKRVSDVADYIIDTGKTIRETAKLFNVSKSTIHKDLKERLLELDEIKYQKIERIMGEHIETRHLKGGESTRQLFLRKKELSV